MTYLVIDPPVSPFDSLAKLNAWRDELLELEKRYADDPTALETVVRCLESVDEWITQSPIS